MKRERMRQDLSTVLRKGIMVFASFFALTGCGRAGRDVTGPDLGATSLQGTLVDFDECPALEESWLTLYNITDCQELDEWEQSLVMEVFGAEFKYWDSTCWGIRNAVAGILQGGRGYRVDMDPSGLWWRNAGVDRIGWYPLNFASPYRSVLRKVTVHEGWHAWSGSTNEETARHYETWCFTEGGVS